MNYPKRREILGYLRAHGQWECDGDHWGFLARVDDDHIVDFGSLPFGQWPQHIAYAEDRDVDAVVLDIRHHATSARLEKLESALDGLPKRLHEVLDGYAQNVQAGFDEVVSSLRGILRQAEDRFRALERGDQRLVPPWSELDYGIRPVVRLLFDAGLQPFASCEGGEGHIADRPFVNIASNPDELDDIANKAAAALVETGYRGFNVSRVTNHQAEASPWSEFPSYVSIELWEGVDVDDA